MSTGLDIFASLVSANVLKMNFMKRTAMRIEENEKVKKFKLTKDEPSVDKSRIYFTVQTINDDPKCSLGSIFNEERMTILEDLRFGRFSYNGQNLEIEKHMAYHEAKCLEIKENNEAGEIEVSNEND